MAQYYNINALRVKNINMKIAKRGKTLYAKIRQNAAQRVCISIDTIIKKFPVHVSYDIRDISPVIREGRYYTVKIDVFFFGDGHYIESHSATYYYYECTFDRRKWGIKDNIYFTTCLTHKVESMKEAA